MNWWVLIPSAVVGAYAGYLLAQNARLRRQNTELVNALSLSNGVMVAAGKAIERLMKEREGQ